MKKILLTAIMLVGLSAFSKAQTTGRVGINTTTPAATLDVVANTTDNARPDALLVPRMTRAQLLAKDAAYTTAQNGALAFVTTIDGTATPKTTNVTAVGFYYYDGQTTNTWITVGGGGIVTPVAPSVRTSATGADLSAADLNGYVFLTTNADLSTIPVSAATKGKTITLVKVGGGTLTVNGASAASFNSMTTNGRGLGFVYDGASWQSYSAQ
ncbi:hypothetical protein KYG33_09850 [Chryseobacterium sp. D764]|jgi:hypothetical protein|uniref:hypothetical protein n=1 Tax=unclassified Chryseobacterium TaxID=2593645 RepID=UPI000984CCBB|nr:MULTISPECIES: hypothetical protein [unclassified Chryseobacterium]QXU51319.1 hypothetical protein KYG33_09850 [Chryseobacterium sp. D764]CAD0220880.1 conserved exported protein of unknown function [Chryseobacterium sp. JV274]